MKLRILPEAELEAAEAAAWYDDRQIGLGDDFLSEVMAAIHRVADDPLLFARLESYTGCHHVRRCVLERFPFLIIFICRPNEAVVVAISHVRRRPLYWMERLR